LVETELFSAGALDYYTKKNMGWEYTEEEYKTWQLAERGGAQGDYRDGMQKKIANVIDCLKTEPLSKRAIIPIPFATEGSETVDWTDQGQTKCCRELHLYLEDGKLKCSKSSSPSMIQCTEAYAPHPNPHLLSSLTIFLAGIIRMQNANIFVKNIHFFATLIDYVAKELDVEVGEYTHWITNLCHDRTATNC
jgi:thymidylate synthase